MNSFALVRMHTRIQTLSLLRLPAYVVPTIAFPAMFFVLFDLSAARTQAAIADVTTLSFVAFAIIGVALYQFGVGIAQERGRPWERYVRTLPVSAVARFAARIASALLFGILTAALVALVSRAFTPIDLGASQWLRVLMYAAIGGVPFVLIGISIGYWASAQAAVPIATAVNLLFAYAGGLWMPPQYLPGIVQRISPYLPTRQFADLLWSVIHGAPPHAFASDSASHAIAGLALYAAIFFALASIGYRRDENKRYA